MVTGQTAQSAGMPDDAAVVGGLSHRAFFYSGERDYLAQIEAFARAGLDNGEPVLIAVPGDKVSVLREHLGGRIRYADITQLGRNPARIIPALREFIDAHPGQRVRYVGEPVWPGRSAAEMCEAARHEALVNLAFARTEAAILCPYDAAGLPPSVVSEAERTHQAVLGNGHPAAAGHAGPGGVPPRCDRPLPDPPATAETLSYESDLRAVRTIVANHARRAGLPDEQVANLVLAASNFTAGIIYINAASSVAEPAGAPQSLVLQPAK